MRAFKKGPREWTYFWKLTLSVFRHFFEPTSQILTVLSSEAVQIRVESELQATSETPNLWPAMTASILPSIALQILTVRSAFVWDYFIGSNQFYVQIEQGLLG